MPNDNVTSVSLDMDEDVETTEEENSQGAEGDNSSAQEGYLGGKYKTDKDLEAGYKELQRELSRLKQGDNTDDDDEADTPDDEVSDENNTNDDDVTEDDLQIPDEAATKSLDWEGLTKEVADNGGKPTDDILQKFEDVGIPKDVINNYFSLVENQAATNTGSILAEAGGKEAYGDMMSWASSNLSADEKAAFNDTVKSGNVAAAKLAVRGLKAQYERSEGYTGNRVSPGKGSSQTGVEPYENETEMMKDMGTDKYRESPKFRAHVERRLDASMKAGTL